MLVSVYVTLAVVGALEEWLVVLVVSRDVMIVLAYVVSWIMARPIPAKPDLRLEGQTPRCSSSTP